MDRIDPELGPVRRCRRCREWWPLTGTFYEANRPGRRLMSCKACRAEHRPVGRIYRIRTDLELARERARHHEPRPKPQPSPLLWLGPCTCQACGGVVWYLRVLGWSASPLSFVPHLCKRGTVAA